MMSSAPPAASSGLGAISDLLRLVADPEAAQKRLAEIQTGEQRLADRSALHDERERALKTREDKAQDVLATAQAVAEREAAVAAREAAMTEREGACRSQEARLATETESSARRQRDLEALARQIHKRDIAVATREAETSRRFKRLNDLVAELDAM